MVWFKPELLGSSRSDDDGNKNICLDPLNFLNEGIFFLELSPYSGLYPDSEKENSWTCIHVLHKRVSEFHAVHCSCVVDVKEICAKKRDASAELLFCL